MGRIIETIVTIHNIQVIHHTLIPHDEAKQELLIWAAGRIFGGSWNEHE